LPNRTKVHERVAPQVQESRRAPRSAAAVGLGSPEEEEKEEGEGERLGAERTAVFAEGPLGLSLVLSTSGRAVVKSVNADTQAELQGVRVDDVLCEIGATGGGVAATNLRSLVLHQGIWDEVVIRPLQRLSRPLALVVAAGRPTDTVPKKKAAALERG
jgi:hypothetical protein